MILAQNFEKATQLLLDMIIISDRFDNELTSEKGVGKVFAKVSSLFFITLPYSILKIFSVVLMQWQFTLSRELVEAGFEPILRFLAAGRMQIIAKLNRIDRQ